MGAVVVLVGHDRLVHGTIPHDVSRTSESVSVHILVVLMVDRVLSGSPLAVSIGDRRVGGQHTGQGPVEQVGVVRKRLGLLGVVVQENRAVCLETTTDTTDNEEHDPSVGETATGVEALDRELTDESESEEASPLGTGSVAGPVEVGFVDGSGHFLHVAAGEPRAENSEVFLGLGRPVGQLLFEDVLRDTEANELTVLNVLGSLGVNLSTVPVIVSILNETNSKVSRLPFPIGCQNQKQGV